MRFDIDAILAKADLLAYVERAGGEPKGSSNRYACACPLHGGDNPSAFSIYVKDGKWLWNCFTGSCGGGDAIKFVEIWQGLDFRQACEWINGGAIEDAQGMRESAEKRLEAARIETIAAKEREDARRKELQAAERHLFYHKARTQYHRDAWMKAGIDEGMQEFWTLGGCEDFTYKHGGELYHSPTLTIPIFGADTELLTIQHRLLNPKDPHDKYRPETAGLHAHPFLAVPLLGYDGDTILVVEGAKKAMVTWTRVPGNMQCIGVPSQEGYKPLIEVLKPVGERVVVIPDPNSERNSKSLLKAWHLAKEVGGKFMQTPIQIDDYILMSEMSGDTLYRMIKQARRV